MAAASSTTNLAAAGAGWGQGDGSGRTPRRPSIRGLHHHQLPHYNQNAINRKKSQHTAAALEQLRFPSRFDTVDPVIENLRKYDQ